MTLACVTAEGDSPQILFLPGASGNVDFWRPVAQRLDATQRSITHVGWPGFGQTPPDPTVRTIDDLSDRVTRLLDRPTVLVAQSMGGVVALLATLRRPAQVTHLVLAALSGGLDMRRFGARDWRPPRDRIGADPAHLFAAHDDDLAPRLPTIDVPTLLLWGDADPISPVAAGTWLERALPNAQLHVIQGGTHTFAATHANEVGTLIDRHLKPQIARDTP
jgi:pimeloyl-ACP methyl ester carboxylesterase